MRFLDDEFDEEKLSNGAVKKYRAAATMGMQSETTRLRGLLAAFADITERYKARTAEGLTAKEILTTLNRLCQQIRESSCDLERELLSLAVGHEREARDKDLLKELLDQVPLLQLFDTEPDDSDSCPASSSPVDGCCGHCRPSGEGSTSSVSGEGGGVDAASS